MTARLRPHSEGFPSGRDQHHQLRGPPARTTFEPDRLQNEVGAKGCFGPAPASGAAFYDLWSNIQSDQYR